MKIKQRLVQVKKEIIVNGSWQGYICANNVNTSHIWSGWNIGSYIEVNTLAQFNNFCVGYRFANCCYELGYYLQYWKVTEDKENVS